MPTRRNLLSIAVGAIPASLVLRAEPAMARADHSNRLSDVATRLMDVARVPALAYAVIRGGRIAEARSLGFRKPGEPVTPTTYFDAASLTKPVFASIVLALADAEVIDLDRPLQAYRRLFQSMPARAITARHVLSHSTGLPNWHFSLRQPLTSSFPPGSRWGYSGEAYFRLLQVVEHLTGKTLADLMQEYVFGPSGMRTSTIVWNAAVAANYAAPHDNMGDPIDSPLTTDRISMTRRAYAERIGVPMERWPTEISLQACAENDERPVPGNASPNPAFGLWTTAEDYARFLIFAGRRQSLAEPLVRMRGMLGWGLGWGLELGARGAYAWQWGDANGIKNIFMFHLPTRSGLVILTNGDNGARIYKRLVRRELGAEFDAFLWI